MKKLMTLLLVWLPMVTTYAQTDSVTISHLTNQFPKLQPLKVDMSNILPDKQKPTTAFSPVFHTEWPQLFVPSANNYNMKVDMRRAMMAPYWSPAMFEDVRVQPIFKFKSGKNSYSFGIGINMDAVRRGIDIQRMEQRQQQMMNMRRW